MRPRILLYFLSGMVFLWGCTEETFTSGSFTTPEQATPNNLTYPSIANAREFGAITSGLPTVETGGLIPAFEITAGYDGDGNPLPAAYMDCVSILTPSLAQIGNYPDDVTPMEVYDQSGNLIEVVPGEPINVNNYKNAGRISIASGNPFAHGEYAFDIKVTTVLHGIAYSTTFPKAARFTVLPALPSALLFIPMAQNLVIGGETSTTTAYMPSGNPDVTYSLGSDTDKLTMQPQTGAISLKAGYAPAEQVTLTPTIIVTNNINDESVVFEGSASLLSIVVSATPVVLPLQEKYFFVPTLASNNLTDGYRTHVTQLGSMAAGNVWTRQAASGIVSERPAALTGNYQLMNNTTAGANMPHDSWVIFTPQNLSNFSFGFELSATFWLQNQYVLYLKTTGKAPCELRIMVSTDYATTMSTPESATWTDVTDNLTCDVINNSVWTAETTGLPYPGANNINAAIVDDQALSLKNAAFRWDNPRWARCVLDLEPWKNAESFTLALHHISNYEGSITYDATSPGYDRPGRFTVVDVYYKAKEKPANP